MNKEQVINFLKKYADILIIILLLLLYLHDMNQCYSMLKKCICPGVLGFD